MGKKNKRQRSEEDLKDDIDYVDPELFAEMEAIRAIQREKYPSAGRGGADDDDDDVQPQKKGAYHKEGLQLCINSLDTAKLPFEESMVLCRFAIDVPDEHDDLQREVRNEHVFL